MIVQSKFVPVGTIPSNQTPFFFYPTNDMIGRTGIVSFLVSTFRSVRTSSGRKLFFLMKLALSETLKLKKKLLFFEWFWPGHDSPIVSHTPAYDASDLQTFHPNFSGRKSKVNRTECTSHQNSVVKKMYILSCLLCSFYHWRSLTQLGWNVWRSEAS